MSYKHQCSVCGNKVDADKNMVAEHNDKKGNKCYGSFTPVTAFDPFYVKRSQPLPNHGFQPLGGMVGYEPPVGGFPVEPQLEEYSGSNIEEDTFFDN
jgi:hypothetical protein